MDWKAYSLFLLAVASVNLSIAAVRPVSRMTPISYGAALFFFGVAMLIAIEGCK